MNFAKNSLNATHSVIGVLACMFISFSTAAIGQLAQPFIGSWKASWQSENKSYDAVMNLTETGGNWQTYTRSHNNPCAGREVPIKVESASPTDVKLLLQFSEVIPGCRNAIVTLKAGPDGVVTGLRSKFELTLVRQ